MVLASALHTIFALHSRLDTTIRRIIFADVINRREWYLSVANECKAVVTTWEQSAAQPYEYTDCRYVRGQCFEFVRQLERKLNQHPETVDTDIAQTAKQLQWDVIQRASVGRLHQAPQAAIEPIVLDAKALETRCRLRAAGLEDGHSTSASFGNNVVEADL